MAPTVSIIIPNYNHEKFLKTRLDSVFNQTFQNFEVILLDDASTDNSLSILRRYATRSKVSHFSQNKQNSGSPFKQWEKGIELSRGEYIWIAESDDYCATSFLEEIFEFIRKSDKKTELVYTQSVDIDKDGNKINSRISWTSEFEPNIWKTDFIIPGNDFIKDYLKVKNVIPNASAVLFKKDLLNDAAFSPDMLKMKMCGDWWFWISVASKTNVGFVAESLNYFRNHGDTSRIHADKQKRLQRLIEEAEIRKILHSWKIQQASEIEKLYQNWNFLHSTRAIINKDFYRVLVKKGDKLNFLKSFLKLKFNGK